MLNKLKGSNIEVSIIVPAYQAQDFIYDNLIELRNILKKSKKSFEIICIVDGGYDNTLAIAKGVSSKFKEVKVFGYEANRGKGYAVRYGMKKAKGTIIGFVDAGRDLIYEDILQFFRIMEKEKVDIVIGSKRHTDSVVNYPSFRKMYSFGYQFYVKNLFGLQVNDTQAGMKIFKKNILEKIIPSLCVDGFAFDIEILSIAQKLLKAKIVEAPIHVNLDETSSTIKIKGGFLINSLKVFLDTLGIYYRLQISGSYKSKINK